MIAEVRQCMKCATVCTNSLNLGSVEVVVDQSLIPLGVREQKDLESLAHKLLGTIIRRLNGVHLQILEFICGHCVGILCGHVFKFGNKL